MQNLAIGFIGTGGIGAQHAQGMRALPQHFRLVAASDSNLQALARFADACGISRRHADYRQVLADAEVEAVVILLPHHLHEQVATEALAAGKHVLLEKPIARTLAEADRIIQAARCARRTLMIGHNQRFDSRHAQVARSLASGALGRVLTARIDHQQHFNPPAGSWWRSREQVGGGCVIGSGIHRLDLLRWWFGEVDEVAAQLQFDATRLEGEVACSAVLRFGSGVQAEFLCHWGIHRPTHGESLFITGVDGTITISCAEPGRQSLAPHHEQLPFPDGLASGQESLWRHFHRCVTTGATPLTSGEDGRASLALVLDVVRSGTLRIPVRCAPLAAMQLHGGL